MDPEALLRQLRMLIREVLAGRKDRAYELAECAADLDTWISNGGFLPYGWSVGTLGALDDHQSKGGES